MKKLLKHMGVLGLIIAVLLPFMDMPKVNAAEECSTHLQNYFFLDYANFFDKATVEEYKDDGYKLYERRYASGTGVNNAGQINGTIFPFVFHDTGNNEIKIKSIELNGFNQGDYDIDDMLVDYWENLQNAIENNDGYKRYTKTYGNALIVDSGKFSSSYTDNTLLIHGSWSSADDNFNYANYEDDEYLDRDPEDLAAISIQSILSEEDLSAYKVNLYKAEVDNNGDIDTTNDDFTADYLEELIDTKEGLYLSKNDEYHIPMTIQRYIKTSSKLDVSSVEKLLNNYIFGRETTESKNGYYVFLDVENEDVKKLLGTEKVKDGDYEYQTITKTNLKKVSEEDAISYTAFKEGQVVICTDCEEDNIDFNVLERYYWPVVLNVEYESCSTTGDSSADENKDQNKDQHTQDRWSISFDDNVNDNSVTNMPSKIEENTKNDITLPTSKPSRSGYAFQKWCSNSNGSGSCYEAGKTVKYDKETDVKLYAIWGKTGSEENEKTGVVSYILGFGAVALVAGGIYFISKKKNLFKKI